MNGGLKQTSMAGNQHQPCWIQWVVLSLLGVGLGWAGLNLVATEVVFGQQAEATGNSPTAATAAGGLARSTLRSGSKGTEVSELQATLKLLGYYGGAVDGVYGETTVTAVSLFQQAAGLSTDGIAGPATWNRLFPPTPPVSATSFPIPATSRPAVSHAASPVGSKPANSMATVRPPSSVSSKPPSSPTDAKSASPTTVFPSPSGLAPAPTSQTPVTAAATVNPVKKPNPSTTNSHSPQRSVATNSSNAAAELVSLPILRLGMKGPAVVGLQRRLRSIGLLRSTADGVFGSETQEAVKAAQRKFKLEADGVVGPSTWIELMQ
jgi:peptidoglycan hydrolase-like protein with peptidoglycan-binding domain